MLIIFVYICCISLYYLFLVYYQNSRLYLSRWPTQNKFIHLQHDQQRSCRHLVAGVSTVMSRTSFKKELNTVMADS